jgi:hypothetical protein
MNDTLLVVDVGVGLVGLAEKPSGCNNGWTKTVLVRNAELNHGLAVNGTQIYASSVETVYRYEWNPSTRTISGNEQVVTGMDLMGSRYCPRLADRKGAELYRQIIRPGRWTRWVNICSLAAVPPKTSRYLE